MKELAKRITQDAIRDCWALSPRIALNVALAAGRLGADCSLLGALYNEIAAYIVPKGLTGADRRQWSELQHLVSAKQHPAGCRAQRI